MFLTDLNTDITFKKKQCNSIMIFPITNIRFDIIAGKYISQVILIFTATWTYFFLHLQQKSEMAQSA